MKAVSKEKHALPNNAFQGSPEVSKEWRSKSDEFIRLRMIGLRGQSGQIKTKFEQIWRKLFIHNIASYHVLFHCEMMITVSI